MYYQDVFHFAEIRLASSSETSRQEDQRLQTLKLQGELLIEIEDFVFAIRNPIRKELSSDFNGFFCFVWNFKSKKKVGKSKKSMFFNLQTPNFMVLVVWI
jgi:hypothetical protein